MSDEKEVTGVEETPVEATVETTENPTTEPEVTNATDGAETEAEVDFDSLSNSEKYSYLAAQRMGNFKVRMTYNDLKFIKNTLNGKIEYKGPKEAYLLIISFLSIDGILNHMDPKNQNPAEFDMSSAAIESISHFLTRVTGKGVESAQKLFSISMLLRTAMEQIRTLDQRIEEVKSALKSQKSEEKTDK